MCGLGVGRDRVDVRGGDRCVGNRYTREMYVCYIYIGAVGVRSGNEVGV